MADDATISQVTSILTGQPADPPEVVDKELADVPEVEPEAQDPEPDETPDDATPELAEGLPTQMSVKQLAEKLGCRPEDVYSSLTIDMMDGEALPLNEFKDRAKDLHKAEQVLSDAQLHRAESENELMRKQRAHVVATGGREYSDTEIQAADKQWNKYVETEDRRLKAAIGSWKDPAQQTADEQAMTDLLGEYGFSEVEAGAIKDYRLRKQLYDHAQQKQRLAKAAESEVKVTRKQPGKAQRTIARKGLGEQAKAALGRKEISQEQAVAAILAEGLNR